MDNEERAYAFEALICRVQRHAVIIAGMKADNKQREHQGLAMAYDGIAFEYEAEKFEDFAKQFEGLSNR